MTIRESALAHSREADEKRRVLKRIYEVYENGFSQLSVACHRGCDPC